MSAHPPSSAGRWPWILGLIAAGLAAACLLLFLFRLPLAAFALHAYLSARGVPSQIEIDSIGTGGVTAHGSLGPEGSPVLSFQNVTVRFDPRNWLPKISQVDVQRPVLRVSVGRDGVSFGPLQPLLDPKPTQSKSAGDLVIAVTAAEVHVATPAGPIEIDGSARLRGGRPVRIDATVAPAHLRSAGTSVDIASGSMTGISSPNGLHLRVILAGRAATATASGLIHADSLRFSAEISDIAWKTLADGMASAASSAVVTLSAAAYRQGTARPWSLQARISNPRVEISGGHLASTGVATLSVAGSLSRSDAETVVGLMPLVGSEPRSAKAFKTALTDWTANAVLSWRAAAGALNLDLAGPATVRGAGPVLLEVSPQGAGLHVSRTTLSGGLAIHLSGRDVPQFAVIVPAFAWRRGSGEFQGQLNLLARLDFGAFRGAAIDGRADAVLRQGALLVSLRHCAKAGLASYEPRRKRMFSRASAGLCGLAGQPFLRLSHEGWMLQADARDVSADLDTAKMQLRGDGRIVLAGTSAGPREGTIDLRAMIAETAKAERMKPIDVAGSFVLNRGIGHGRFTVAAGPKHSPIGHVTATYRSGRGRAALDFPDVAFSPQGLQPANLSPMLASLAQADGRVNFKGWVDWSARRLRSSGRLDVDDLRFRSPLGPAQQLRTHMVFTSLLPLTTAPDQRITVTRVDWLLPITETRTDVSLSPARIHIDDTQTHLAGGEIALTPLAIEMRPGRVVHGTVRLSHVALGAIIAASNLGKDLRLEGTVSGSLPFTYGPEGWHFAGGRITADGPGRLSINPALWGTGEANAVEQAAYKALENLAYVTLTATADSQPGGRLRVVFKFSGYTDSPAPKHSEFSLFELLNGKAFQRDIPVPKGTAINLTLDTSLNFDELLRGYESAWSQVTALAK
ncbi:MAG: YdbH domain-containing protein [Alphaproteobacteria bacterium]|nr:YdbH domain-containing protein [Alphaproteobacteria bacterium]